MSPMNTPVANIVSKLNEDMNCQRLKLMFSDLVHESVEHLVVATTMLHNVLLPPLPISPDRHRRIVAQQQANCGQRWHNTSQFTSEPLIYKQWRTTLGR